MSDTITLTGLVATDPRHVLTSEALPITSFRLASTQRRFDRAKSQWVDGDTNWYTITAFRQLALNSSLSVKKGDRVVVVGRLRIRDWAAGERNGTTIEIEAESLGHDLSWGTAAFTRSISLQSRTTDAGSAPTTGVGQSEFPVEFAESPGSTDADSPGAHESDTAGAATLDSGGFDDSSRVAVDAVAVPF
jgi:single-strand DNA-binding protein